MSDHKESSGQVLLTVDQMGRADKAAVKLGVPGERLMDAAGWAVAMQTAKRFPPCRVSILCGPGNNGGDGFAAARYLRRRGWPVRLGLLGRLSGLKGDAALHASLWEGGIEPLSPGLLDGADLVIDALFGAGLSRPLSGIARQVIEQIAVPVVAVDVPSGVHGDSGQVMGAAAQACLTVTFFRKKPGHLLLPGRDLCGEVALADIGIPEAALDAIKPRCWENGPALWTLPKPGALSHKYARGHALILGGAEMTGAARLASRAARRAGAGMATLAAPSSSLPLYGADQAGLVTRPLDRVAELPRLIKACKANALLAGPGLGLGRDTGPLVLAALAARLPTVLDADALSVFEGRAKELFKAIQSPCLMTPHGGEFKRLFASTGDRLSQARLAAKACGAVILLKGADTVIAHPDGRAVINEAPPDLATAGSGDVLAGLAAGLMAQGMPPFEAAQAASWLHAEAGRRLGAGLVAEDLAGEMPALLAGLGEQPGRPI
jgi:hydroxyethylthiazole kinase-like uncharacterized protein yjeF